MESNMQGGAYPFTKYQYEEIISLLKNKPDTALAATTTGMSTTLLASNSTQECIIDTGATNHMLSDNSMLDPTTIKEVENPI